MGRPERRRELPQRKTPSRRLPVLRSTGCGKWLASDRKGVPRCHRQMGKVLRRRRGRDVGSGTAWTVPCDVGSPVPAAGRNRPRDVIETRPTAGMQSALDSWRGTPIRPRSGVPLGGVGCPGAWRHPRRRCRRGRRPGLDRRRGPGARGALRYRRPRCGALRTGWVRRSRRRAEHGVPARPRRWARCLVRPTPGAVADAVAQSLLMARRAHGDRRGRCGRGLDRRDLARRVTVTALLHAADPRVSVTWCKRRASSPAERDEVVTAPRGAATSRYFRWSSTARAPSVVRSSSREPSTR